ncbi:hypothetical protein [Chitinophaga caseinilytica]|uniref:hypothetical protein n=1 Tax=Chitinophaga caseinilytica TaxID=2267521 RepID=UPI003C308E93
MAKQKGIVPLEGTIGNVTFYKSKAGYLAREKGGVDGNRIATDPAFARTRENGSEFGRAGKAGRLLRTSLRALLLSINDTYMSGRLTREFVKVIRADETNTRGQRNVIDGEAELLQGFEFNQSGRLGSTLYAPFTPAIDRVTGELSVALPSFVPLNMIAAPAGATHYKINTAGVEVDFEAETFVVDLGTTGEGIIGTNPTAMTTLTANVTPASTKPLFLAVGIEFFQQVNGVTYPLRNGAYNALSLVLVSSGV